MSRITIFLAAVAASTLTVTGTVDAAGPSEFDFRLTEQSGERIRADFRRVGRQSEWNSSFAASEFLGLDRSRLAGTQPSPVQFALVRDAGRLDCSGNGGKGVAAGRCRFTSNERFFDYLRSSGVSSLSDDDRYTMTAIGVRRDLVAAIRQANYPAPSASDLISLAALGVERGYIDRLAAAGYRPDRIDTLIQYKALGITPEYIAGLHRAGFAGITASQLVQFKALGIDSAYIESLRAAGYAGLPAGTLVEFKALGVTGQYLADLRRRGFAPAPGKIIQMKALGITPEEVGAIDGDRR